MIVELSPEEVAALQHAVGVLDAEALLDMAAVDREPEPEIARHLARRVNMHRRMSGVLGRLLARAARPTKPGEGTSE